jgi:hypothetical protein
MTENKDWRKVPICGLTIGSKKLLPNRSVLEGTAWCLMMRWTMLGLKGRDLNRPYPLPRKVGVEEVMVEWGYPGVEEMQRWVSVEEETDLSEFLASND